MSARDTITMLCATAAGIAIAYVDSRPHWDDTAITAFAMFVAAAIAGAVAPRRPYLAALCVGIWITAHAIAIRPSAGSLAMLVVLAFPLAGAYAGAAIARAAARRRTNGANR